MKNPTGDFKKLVEQIERELRRLGADQAPTRPDGYTVAVQSFQHKTVRVSDAESFRVVSGLGLLLKLQDLQPDPDDPLWTLTAVYRAIGSF
jgi:hypothetical protein